MEVVDAGEGPQVIISNIGASGKDGVRVHFGESQCMSITESDTYQAGDVPDGSFSEFELIGSLQGVPNVTLIGFRNEVHNGLVESKPDFSQLGSSGVHVAFFQDGVLNKSYIIDNGDVAYTQTVVCGYSYMGT